VKKRNTHLRAGISIAALFLLAISLVASQALASPKGSGGGIGRGGGGGGRSFSVSRAGAGIGARSFSGARFSGRSSSRSAVRSANVKLHTGSAGAHFAGASPHTFATAGALSRPAGLARAHAALGNRVITNAAFKSSFARPPMFFGRFHGSHWPWWRAGIVIGWIGPVFWPYAYYDFFDYVFWPYAYDGFWPYAYEDVYYGIYGDYGYVDPVARAGRSRSAQALASEQRAVGVCSENAPELTDWPIERISQVVEPNEAQRAALDELKSATAKSIDILKAACPNDLPSIPTGRMAAMEGRLQVMLRAVQTVRPPLEAFFNLLSDEQKARFNAIAPADAQGARKDQRDLTRLCSGRGPGIADLPIDRIAQAVSPTETQQPALDELRTASAKAAEALKNNCPTSQALTPTGRVEAMEQRFTTMLEAVKTVQPALIKFYDSLTYEQRARFNTLGSTRPGA
jgi:LTXXQ motif family protein